MDNIAKELKKYFKQISEIPRASGDEKEISDFLVNFAKSKNLEVYQDDLYNLIIKKKSTIKNCNVPAVILQGHMDMVYVKNNNSNHDYKDGIEVIEEDGFLFSNDTSLGGDNGVAIAYLMMLMSSSTIKHPDLEIIITVQEEVGLAGAEKIDTSKLKGKHYINLDAENEGMFFVSCSGGVRNEINMPKELENNPFEKGLQITIEGLKGGHSGLEIHKQRGNAIVFMARLLNMIMKTESISVSTINCNGKANAIPDKCTAEIWCKDTNTLSEIVSKSEQLFSKELNPKDTVTIKINDIDSSIKAKVLKKEVLLNIISTILLMPNGVINMDKSIPDLVETSVNIGALNMDSDSITLLSSIRSSVESRKEEQIDKIITLSKLLKNETIFYNNYPGWEYNPNSNLRNIAKESYKELTNKEPIEAAIHAGLECGYFNKKIEDLDIISFGPNLYDVHTTKEKLDLNSAVSTFKLLLTILRKLC